MQLVDWIVSALRDPGPLIAWGGYPALALIVFLETGALVFFLPGDSLLVMAGLFAAKGDLDVVVLNALLIPAAVIGDAASYWLGARAGRSLFARQRSWLFRPEHVAAAHAFYERHGGKAIIVARFMPLVRTFVPVVAGVAGMSYRRFAFFNVVGAAAWVGSMTLTGYVLGTRFPLIVEHIEKVILAIVVLSILPGVVAWIRARRGQSVTASKSASARSDTMPQ